MWTVKQYPENSRIINPCANLEEQCQSFAMKEEQHSPSKKAELRISIKFIHTYACRTNKQQSAGKQRERTNPA
ncbi:hypothetical protein EUGRSUZ_B00388 [Eucalyptus grandis]|uniref:Uncharacterized protein n=2 Tax=Eucalyptus grandis TaxID=71139 RepID=A0ACC3LM07_EUCGR|nr:hypothetical protein EUGRSUZ_B00388 [Eucalyptus grandis]